MGLYQLFEIGGGLGKIQGFKVLTRRSTCPLRWPQNRGLAHRSSLDPRRFFPRTGDHFGRGSRARKRRIDESPATACVTSAFQCQLLLLRLLEFGNVLHQIEVRTAQIDVFRGGCASGLQRLQFSGGLWQLLGKVGGPFPVGLEGHADVVEPYRPPHQDGQALVDLTEESGPIVPCPGHRLGNGIHVISDAIHADGDHPVHTRITDRRLELAPGIFHARGPGTHPVRCALGAIAQGLLQSDGKARQEVIGKHLSRLQHRRETILRHTECLGTDLCRCRNAGQLLVEIGNADCTSSHQIKHACK